MSSIAGLVAVSFAALSSGLESEAGAFAMHYNVRFDATDGTTKFVCRGSSSGTCTFWFGDPLNVDRVAGSSATLNVGNTPLTVKIASTDPAYCAGLDAKAPPKWPDCVHGPLGGLLHGSIAVDYRWK